MTAREAAILAFAWVAALSARSGGAGGGEVAFTPHEIGTGLRGGYQVVVADLDRDGKPDVIALAQGLPELVWYENPGNAWRRRMLDDRITNGHAIVAVDIDDDGNDEFVVGQRGGSRSLLLFKAARDGVAWSRCVLDEGGMAGAGLRGGGPQRRQTAGHRMHWLRDGKRQMVRKYGAKSALIALKCVDRECARDASAHKEEP